MLNSLVKAASQNFWGQVVLNKPLELLLDRPKMYSIPFQNKIADPLGLETYYPV